MRPIGIRPLEAEDADELRALFSRLSPTTVFLRFFHAVRSPSDGTLLHLASVDHDRREALAAVVGDRIIGVARYDRSPSEPARAEVAIVVEDEWQGHGIGVLLMARLMEVAEAHGIRTLTASVLGENTRMLHLAKVVAPDRRVHLDHGEWELEIPLGLVPA